jgi:hypothetical protein
MLDSARLVQEGRRKPHLRRLLGRIQVPVLAVSGLGDRVDPAGGCERFIAHFASAERRFVAAGVQTGFARDYDHAGIVVSKPAQEEIWPLVTRWLLGKP